MPANSRCAKWRLAPEPMPPISAFHRSAVRVAVRGALSVSAVLGLGLAIAAVPLPASATVATSAPAKPADPNQHPDFDHDALGLITTTDTLPEDQAAHFQAIAGDPVNRVYYLHNRGLLPLENVTVSDPGNNGAAIHCAPTGTATVPTLLPLAFVTCTSTFTATAGEKHTTATASGIVFLFGVTLTGEDQTGYTAVVPALSASLSLNGGQPTTHLPVGTPVSAVITMVNPGSVPLQQVGPLPPQPPLSIIGCGGDADNHGATVDKLNPGQSAFCTGALIPQPGAHESSVTVAGTWRWDHPITAQGPQSPKVLSIQTVASAQYTGVAVPTPPPPTPPPPTPPPPHPGPPPTPAPPGSTPALLIPPQSPLPSPSPSPTPSPHRPTPVPTSSQIDAVLQQAVSQFQAQRQLPLPLKVLVIIIVPAVAAAAGARRIASSRR